MGATDETKVGGWFEAMGLKLLHARPDEVRIEWTVAPQHLQPFGLVHGGVHAGVVETACSLGAATRVAPDQVVVGVENQTSFLRPARSGELYAVAKPVHVGRTTQLWEAEIRDAEAHLIAVGRVRLMAVRRP